MKHVIRLEKTLCEENRLTYKFSSSLKVFNQKSFFIEYDRPIENPVESINSIPFAAVMAPIAWATGAELILPELDKDYALSLERCTEHFKKWFSKKWSFKTRLDAHLVKNTFAPTRHAMLFSGGLDSMTTYLHHKDKNPRLFTIFGADIPLSRQTFIESYKNKLKSFATSENTSIESIHTDVREIWNLDHLKPYSKNWYGEVAHGLLLSALVAPVAYDSVKTLMLASCSHRAGCVYTCGSEKDLVRQIQWAGTGVVADNHHLSRAEKILTYLKSQPKYYSQLRVCWMQFESLNCGKCEKCLRTICELLINNIDPALCNFKMTTDTLSDLKKRILNDYYIFFGGESALDYWRTIQEKISLVTLEDQYGSRAFFSWFLKFKKIKARQNPVLSRLFSTQLSLKMQLGKWWRFIKSLWVTKDWREVSA